MIATMAIGPGGGPSKVASKVPDRVGRTLQILKAALKPAGKPHGHHSIPKYLGGPVVQKELAKLAANQHQAFHSGLQYIFPTTGKARSGVAYSTAYYRSLKPATLRQIHNQMAVYTRAFDAKYGTKIWDVMVRNGFPIIP